MVYLVFILERKVVRSENVYRFLNRGLCFGCLFWNLEGKGLKVWEVGDLG